MIHCGTKEVLETLNSSKVSRLAKVDPERCKSYFVPFIFAFDGNNIFIPIDDKLKKSINFILNKNIQKIPIIVVTLFTVVGGIQIILDHHKKRNF